MSLDVHRGSEGFRVALAAIALVIFVIIGLTWIPELISGTENMGSTGTTSRMIR
ncbi:MAG TPA: hypothetical protein VEH76_15280 [Methylocystis sp.]|nr:hypothetical protein [Methylocystis sp.]